MRPVGATHAICALSENGCRIARGRAIGGIMPPPDRMFQAGAFLRQPKQGAKFSHRRLNRHYLDGRAPPESWDSEAIRAKFQRV